MYRLEVDILAFTHRERKSISDINKNPTSGIYFLNKAYFGYHKPFGLKSIPCKSYRGDLPDLLNHLQVVPGKMVNVPRCFARTFDFLSQLF